MIKYSLGLFRYLGGVVESCLERLTEEYMKVRGKVTADLTRTCARTLMCGRKIAVQLELCTTTY